MKNIPLKTFKSIVAWFEENDYIKPAFVYTKDSGTNIESLTKVFPYRLPPDFLEIYRYIDGQRINFVTGEVALGFYLNGQRLMCTNEIILCYESMCKHFNSEKLHEVVIPDTGIRQKWWDEGWLPMISDHCGNFLCIDMHPTKQGIVGQVIQFVHDECDRKIVSGSFNELLLDYLHGLQSGVYKFNLAYGWIE